MNRALLNVFSLIDRANLNHDSNRATIQPRAVQPLGIIGAGIMGSGIATLAVESGLTVLLSDAAPDALEKGQRQIVEELSRDPQTPDCP